MDGDRSRVRYASRLADDLVFVLGSFPWASSGVREAWLEDRDVRLPLDVRCLDVPSRGGARAGDNVLLTLRSAGSVPGGATLVVRGDGDPVTLDLGEALTDLGTLLREGLAWLDPLTRAAVVDFLADVPAAYGPNGGPLSASLALIRDALREPLPPSVVDPEEPCIVFVDGLHRIDESAFFAKGWMYATGEIASLAAVSPEGARVELAGRLFRHARPDVAELLGLPPNDQRSRRLGFAAFFELPAPSLVPHGWTFELREAGGTAREVAGPSVVDDEDAVLTTLLSQLALERLPDEELRREHLRPAIMRLHRRRVSSVLVERAEQYGVPPDAPDVSIVIPLYGRVDFLEHQLAQFIHDPEIAASDLLYVLDSPDLAEEALGRASQLAELYRIPFRLAVLNRNGGFAVANNVGASLARGRLLLLLNSDVVPDRPGWLGRLVAFHDATPRIGALGPKLLYEDGAIQHAGMYFDRSIGVRLWSNAHYFKGLHRDLPEANVSRPVPAVTGACMLVAADLYRQLGGLRGDYVQGDYEDSDLCLRLRAAGYDCWYLAAVELYHLEGQSYPDSLRRRTFEYNRWLHTHLWHETIEELTAAR